MGASLACTSRTTALLCCTPNLTKPPPSLSSGGNKGMESCADATICVLGISVHTPAGDGWRPLSPRHRAGQGRACDWHSSIKELLPPGRGSVGVAQQCPVSSPQRDSPSEWRLAAIRFRTRGSSSAPPGLTAVENRNY